jgi:hypothetical protein
MKRFNQHTPSSSESTGGSQRLIVKTSTNNERQYRRQGKTSVKLEFILQPHLKLPNCESFDLSRESKSIWALLRNALLLIIGNSSTEGLLIHLFRLHQDFIFHQVSLVVIGVCRVQVCLLECLGCGWDVMYASTGCKLSLMGVGATGEVVSCTLARKRLKPKTFKVRAGFARRAVEYLATLIQDKNFIK